MRERRVTCTACGKAVFCAVCCSGRTARRWRSRDAGRNVVPRISVDAILAAMGNTIERGDGTRVEKGRGEEEEADSFF